MVFLNVEETSEGLPEHGSARIVVPLRPEVEGRISCMVHIHHVIVFIGTVKPYFFFIFILDHMAGAVRNVRRSLSDLQLNILSKFNLGHIFCDPLPSFRVNHQRDRFIVRPAGTRFTGSAPIDVVRPVPSLQLEILRDRFIKVPGRRCIVII